MTLDDARAAVDELLKAHRKETDADTHSDLWNFGYHDGLLAAWAVINGKPHPL